MENFQPGTKRKKNWLHRLPPEAEELHQQGQP